MRIHYFQMIAMAVPLLVPVDFLSAQTDTNEGGVAEEEQVRELNDRIRILEQRQAERIERELASLRAQLREAKRLEKEGLPSPRVENDEERPTKREGKRVENDRWRYRYHQGRWWYWLPSESWVFYDNQRWVAYDPRVNFQNEVRRNAVTVRPSAR